MNRFFKRYTIEILFVIMLGFFLVVNYYIRLKSERNVSQLQIVQNSLVFYKTLIDDLFSYQFYEIQSSGKPIQTNIMLEDKNGNLTSLSALIKHRTLIFRFSESDCVACMKEYFTNVNQLLESLEYDDIILIGNFSTTHNIQLFMEGFQVKWPVYNFSKNLNIPIENLELPYFFVVDSNMIAYNFKVAMGVEHYVLESYLKGVAE